MPTIRCNATSARTISVGTTDDKGKPGVPRKVTIAPGDTREVDQDLLDAAMHKDRGNSGLVVASWFDTGELVETSGALSDPKPKGRDKGKGKDKKDD